MTFMIGADPEIFLRKKGKAFSAHGVVPGTKKEPHKVDNGAIQVDGMAVEFNIDPVEMFGDRGFNQFNRNITSVIGQLKEEVKKHDPSLTFNIESVQEFDQEVFDSTPEEAKELGCDPDFNAYTKEQNPRPEGDAVTFRTASGHIHIGWGADIPVEHPDHVTICADFVKLMDVFVGMYMTIIDPESRRRDLYGKAGAFRAKPYGVEYRTPSNLWLSNKSRRETIFILTKIAVNAAKNQYTLGRLLKLDEAEAEKKVQSIINSGDFVQAKSVLDPALRYSSQPPHIRKFIQDEYNSRLTKVTNAETTN